MKILDTKVPHKIEPSFYFYDFETFGTHPAKDRPCQFAGVRTDKDFNIIDEPLVIYCQPTNDYLPDPMACLITGITPQVALEKGLPEPDFIRKIHEQFSKPATCTLGYNNIRFDDEITRYTLYRNFFDPYGWSWQQGNSRWDLLDVMRAAFALRPQGIQWPLNEEGLPSFKLEHLSVANGIEHSNAHDAMADVIATIELAKKLKQAQPRLFDYLYTHRNKNKLNALIDIISMTPLVHISGMFGLACSNTSWVVPVAWHPTNKNALISIDLAKDPSPLFELDAQTLKARLYTKHCDLAPDEQAIPVKLIHINKSPVLAQAKTLTPEDATRLGIDREKCLEHLNKIRKHPQIRETLVTLFSEQNSHFENHDIDCALYDGFFSTSDKAAFDIIRQTTPEQLATLDIKVTDPRISPLLFRYRARHFSWTLDEQELRKWADHRRDYFDNHLPQFILTLDQLTEQHQNDSKKIAILKSLYHYVQWLVT